MNAFPVVDLSAWIAFDCIWHFHTSTPCLFVIYLLYGISQEKKVQQKIAVDTLKDHKTHVKSLVSLLMFLSLDMYPNTSRVRGSSHGAPSHLRSIHAI